LDLGFDTAGNATLIVYDHGPLLVTDPWIDGPAYFGSWTQSHEIGAEQRAAIRAARFIWISHGHPDHLSNQSVEPLRSATILLPDHVGARIADAFRDDGYRVQVLADRRWTRLSDRVRVYCMADPSQDALILIELGDVVIANINDTANTGWVPAVRREMRGYRKSFVLAASGYGDIRGMNFFDESGNRLESFASLRSRTSFPLGQENARLTDALGGSHYVPFSSMHQYQRADSVWANDAVASLADYASGYESDRSSVLPGYVRYDAIADTVTDLRPAALPRTTVDPGVFGDTWSDRLDADEKADVRRYFQSIEGLSSVIDYVDVRVGGESTTVELAARRFERGVTFELPRASLLSSVRYEVFEDLFIGNFMKTTYHGPGEFAYGPFINRLKWADSGRARSAEDLAAYLAEYHRRAGVWNRLRFGVEQRLLEHAHRWGAERTAVYRLGRSLYRRLTR
jgi:hypothetical protein